METKTITIERITLVVPITYPRPLGKLNDFPDCCGAGDGISNTVIPETLFGLRVSAACSIHDFCFKIADATWRDFHQSNYMFLRNLLAIISAKSNWLTMWFRVARASTYFMAVDTIGAKVFWSLKKKQGRA